MEKAEKKSFLAKAVGRCRHLGRRPASPAARPAAAPPGCFPVLVGPERERFVVRAERASHPLFRALLDEAEAEYGFPAAAEPLVLPCAAERFRRVMAEVERKDEEEVGEVVAGGAGVAAGLLAPRSPAWMFFPKGSASSGGGYVKMSPARRGAS